MVYFNSQRLKDSQQVQITTVIFPEQAIGLLQPTSHTQTTVRWQRSNMAFVSLFPAQCTCLLHNPLPAPVRATPLRNSRSPGTLSRCLCTAPQILRTAMSPLVEPHPTLQKQRRTTQDTSSLNNVHLGRLEKAPTPPPPALDAGSLLQPPEGQRDP
jgi:hypothetical protein